MKDFREFATPATKEEIVLNLFIRHGKYHIYSLEDQQKEKELNEQIDVIMETLRAYHKWVSPQDPPQ